MSAALSLNLLITKYDNDTSCIMVLESGTTIYLLSLIHSDHGR